MQPNVVVVELELEVSSDSSSLVTMVTKAWSHGDFINLFYPLVEHHSNM